MILLTGAAGFIGSNILEALNERGINDVIAVDDLTDGRKCANLAGRGFADFLDVSEIQDSIRHDRLPALSAICHQGAIADTTSGNGRDVMQANFAFSKEMLALAERHHCPFVYASSASVYGDGRNGFRESPDCERPQSVYAFSKWAFDSHVRWRFAAEGPPVPVVGLRYFNVYGPGEAHKDHMASVAWQCFEAVRLGQRPRLFAGSDGFLRDFVHVGDVAAVNLYFLAASTPGLSILNVGTGTPRSFRELAECVVSVAGGQPPIFVSFPDDLRDQYQTYTCADITALRAAGYSAAMVSLESGIEAYHHALRSVRLRMTPPHEQGRRAAA